VLLPEQLWSNPQNYCKSSRDSDINHHSHLPSVLVNDFELCITSISLPIPIHWFFVMYASHQDYKWWIQLQHETKNEFLFFYTAAIGYFCVVPECHYPIPA
jgi:hypothetical protein